MNPQKFVVTFSFEGNKQRSIKVNKNCTVSDFLLLVRKIILDEDIKSVYLKGKKLNEDYLLINYFEDPKTELLYVSSDSEVNPDIFFENKPKIIENDIGEEENDSRLKAPKKFKVFTTVTDHSFLNGDNYNFILTDSYDTVLQTIKEHIISIVPPDFPKKYEIHIFLPGGVLFNPTKNPEYNTLISYTKTMKEAYY